MSDHYALFRALISAVDGYMAAHPGMKLYVSGHSLGASMAQHFMETHPKSTFPTSEAILLASPGYGVGITNDPRICNITLDRDAFALGSWISHNSGDFNTIYHNLSAFSGTTIHNSHDYEAFAAFLDANGIMRTPLGNLTALILIGSMPTRKLSQLHPRHRSFPSGPEVMQ